MSGGFWDQRYEKEGKIWGESPSPTAAHALQRFREAGITEILVPGCGYGRNALVFAQEGMCVTGLESSAKALAIARQSSTEIRWVHSSVLDANLGVGAFEGIYAMNLLHLFLAPERKRLIANCRDWLIPGGIACFTVFGDSDSSRGRGREVEADTFESRPGRPAHYFDEDGLRARFFAVHAKRVSVLTERQRLAGDSHEERPRALGEIDARRRLAAVSRR